MTTVGGGLITFLALVLLLGSGVMVFKHHVDEERATLARLQRDLQTAREAQARLWGELAYHRRPEYLTSFADALGLMPAGPGQIVTVDALPVEPPPVAGDGARPHIVALPSGARAILMPRPSPSATP